MQEQNILQIYGMVTKGQRARYFLHTPGKFGAGKVNWWVQRGLVEINHEKWRQIKPWSPNSLSYSLLYTVSLFSLKVIFLLDIVG